MAFLIRCNKNVQKYFSKNISAVVLFILVSICLYFGKQSTLGFVMFFGIVAVDEIFCNFFKEKKKFKLFVAQALFLLFLILILTFSIFNVGMHLAVVNVALVINFLLLIYLFYLLIESKIVEYVIE